MNAQREYRIRTAERADQTRIRGLVRSVRINPMNLDWHNFSVAIDGKGRIIGCGQIKTHRDGTRELASIAVDEEWRRKGVASELIQGLIQTAEPPSWLVCRLELAPFYEQFGFAVIEDLHDLPTSFRRMRSVARVLSRIIPSIGKFAIMMHDRA